MAVFAAAAALSPISSTWPDSRVGVTALRIKRALCINNKTDYHNMSKRIRLTQNIEPVKSTLERFYFNLSAFPCFSR